MELVEVDVEGAEGVAVKAAAPRLGGRVFSVGAREGILPAGITAKVALVETGGVLLAGIAAKVAVIAAKVAVIASRAAIIAA